MSENPSALARLMKEFTAAELDSRNSGIYAAKSGYHNTRAHHLAGSHNGSKDDYSVELAIDRAGPSDKAAAVDISFDSARLKSDFRNIAVYSKRLLTAFKARDPRLFYKSERVVREFFGNADLDREVEGWSLYLGLPRSSDSSHQWHIHISFHRKHVENWDACKGVLDVLLGKPLPKPPTPAPEDDMELTDAQLEKIGLTVNKFVGPTLAKMDKFVHEVEQRDIARAAAEAARDVKQDAVLDETRKLLSDIAGKLDQILGRG